MKKGLLTLTLTLLALGSASATGISDNFESYAVGTFPSPTWLDVGSVFPGPGEPVPSATVVATTNAFGNPTQALAIANAVSYSRGIYAPVAIGSQYSLDADIRVDQYSNAPAFTSSDWAMQLTFAEAGVDNFAFTPQAGIYASSLTGGWRLFLIGGPGADIDLGVPANIGTWYNVSLQFDVATATFHSVIVNVLTGAVLVDQYNTIAGLTPAEAQYNSIAFFGGETSTGDTVADLAVVDNVNISSSPEPSSILLLGAGLAMLAVPVLRR